MRDWMIYPKAMFVVLILQEIQNKEPRKMALERMKLITDLGM